jgi:uncharacterized membrane protein (DUF4010 family)
MGLFDFRAATDIAVAALAGLAVGIEREWSGHGSGPHARFAGVRTFLILGLLAGLAGWLQKTGESAFAVVLLGGGVALTVAAYAVAARRGSEGIEGTTEAAALAVLALGAVAGLGYVTLTAGATAVIVLALEEKTRIHHAVRSIGETELRAGFQFAVLALVILPLLPTGPYGPLGGIRPRALWMVVLLFSGIDFAGYIARRAVGDAMGYGVTGLLGGMVSSTAVTLRLSQHARKETALARPLGVGVVGACTMLFPRVVLVSLVLNPDMALRLLPYLLPPFLAGAVLVMVPLWRSRAGGEVNAVGEPRSPLRLGSAIQMALAFQVVLMIIYAVQRQFGTGGVLWSAGLVGLTDMDALTLAMARLTGPPDPAVVAAKAVAIGTVANAALKLGMTVVLGTSAFRRVASWGLVVLLLIGAAAVWAAW